MAVPNLPFYLSQANQEFLGTPVGNASVTMNTAGVAIPGLVSQLAGMSAMTGDPYTLTLGFDPMYGVVGYSIPDGIGYATIGALSPNTIGGALVGTLTEYDNGSSEHWIEYYDGQHAIPPARIFDVRTGIAAYSTPDNIMGYWIRNGVPDLSHRPWQEAYDTYGDGHQVELLIETGNSFVVKEPPSIIQAQGFEATYYLISEFPGTPLPGYNTVQIAQGDHTIFVFNSQKCRITLLTSTNAYIDYQRIVGGNTFNVDSSLKGISVISVDSVNTGTATFRVETLDPFDDSIVVGSFEVTLESTP